ncbi:hypothetical protein HDV01_004792 [Terramyces sp. JEL0728]|nr:hypothetical protein HDV01_004792 [Terramyces sp. JEL0728]
MVETKYVFAGLLVAAVGYGVYFDYQRRNNPVAKQRKEAAKIKQERPNAPANSSFAIPEEPIPTTNEGREQYFMRNLQAGEQLLQQGPMAFDAAATCFYRALQVYPEPQKLLEVLAQSLPEVIMNMIIQKMADDVRAAQGASIVEEVNTKQNDYYKVYPRADMNVKVHQETSGDKVIRRGLLVSKDVKKGKVVFKEHPIITCPQENLKGKGYCLQCLGEAVSNETCSTCKSEFCSEKCKIECRFHSYLCTDDPDSPATKLNRYLKAMNKLNNRSTINFLLKMAEKEMNATYNHLDRMYGMKREPNDGDKLEHQLLLQIMSNVPGFDTYVTLEKYVSIEAKIKYNSIAIPLKDDAILFSLATEDYGRGQLKGTGIKGVGLYHIAGLISHSCQPNVEYRFDENSQLSIVALDDLANGTELLVSYVPHSEHMQTLIADRYGFQCKCQLCKSE